LHVVFGELAPKSVAIARAEGTALFVAPFMRFFYYLFWPGIVVFNGTANAVVRLFEKRPFAVRMPTLRIRVLYE
jgi:CBS domain containing-hemolysin-like protein